MKEKYYRGHYKSCYLALALNQAEESMNMNIFVCLTNAVRYLEYIFKPFVPLSIRTN